MKVKGVVDVNNMPKDPGELRDGKGGFMVARRATDAELWYYGTYGSERRAYAVAEEIQNGVVIEVAGDCMEEQ